MDLPSWSPFPELFERAFTSKLHFVGHDYSDQKSLVSAQLLHSILAAQNHLRKELKSTTLAKLQRDDEDVFIFVLAAPGWEFTVYMLAILALGAAISPLPIAVLPEEARYCISISNGSAILFSKSLAGSMNAIKEDIAQNDSGLSNQLDFIEMDGKVPIDMPAIYYSDLLPNPHPRPNKAGSLLFTSGTSGKPKGVVHSYNAMIAAAKVRLDHWALKDTDVLLSQNQASWMGGFYSLLPCLLAGAEIEFCSTVFNPEWFWDRVKGGDVSVLDLMPETWESLAQYYEEKISSRPENEKQTYLKAITEVRWAMTGASPLPHHVQNKLTSIRGKPLINQYGTTEVMPISQTDGGPSFVNYSVGMPLPGADVKIVEGELLVRAPWMFSRYISEDTSLTQNSIDSDGYFKTGDCGGIMNGGLIIRGRASIDKIRFCRWDMYAPEIEDALHSLPYISKAVVFGIPDETYHERVTAILSFKATPPILNAPTLPQLQQDLTAKTNIPRFHFPTIAYWLRDGEDVPRAANGKISKLKAKEIVSDQKNKGWAQVEVMDLEAGGNPWDTDGDKWKAWDWGGVS